MALSVALIASLRCCDRHGLWRGQRQPLCVIGSIWSLCYGQDRPFLSLLTPRCPPPFPLGALSPLSNLQTALQTVRTQVLLKLIIPYTRVSITSLAGRINVAPREVEDLLVGLILGIAFVVVVFYH